MVGLDAEPAPEEGAQGIAVVAEVANYAAAPLRGLGHDPAARRHGGRARLRRRAGGRPRQEALRAQRRGRGRHPPGGGGHRPRRLRARRPAGLPGRGLARPARPPRRRRSAHRAHGGRDLLPRGGPAGRRLQLLRHHRPPRRIWPGAISRPSARSSWPTSTARRPRWSRRCRATWRRAAAFSSPSAIGSTPTPGTRPPAPCSPSPSASSAARPRRPATRPEGETVDLRPAERLAPIDRRHPLLSSFPAKGDGLASARFFQFLLLAPVPDAPGRAGGPALRERRAGAGRGARSGAGGSCCSRRRSTASGRICRFARASCRSCRSRRASWRAPPPATRPPT